MRGRSAVFLFLAAVAGVLAPGRSSGAEQTWLRAATRNFELYTTEGQNRARDALIYFEQVRAFFVKNSASLPLPADPVRIVGFRSEKEYRPYSPLEGSGAFYLGGTHHDSIVMQSLGGTLYPVAVHEFVHLVLRHAKVKVPLWLNEGLAELYSTLRPVGRDSLRIGDLPPARVATLSQYRLLSIEALIGADEQWRAGAGREQVGVFYAQSWALTHMLALSNEYRPKFSVFLSEVFGGTDTAAAFQKTYGRSLTEVGGDVNRYLRSSTFGVLVFPFGLEKAAQQPDIRPARPVEWGVVLADLDAARPERRDQARQAYAKLAAGNPERWEPWAGLAYLALGSGEREEAGRHFARAEELGSRDALIYLHWGMYAPPLQEPQQVVRIFKKAVELRPDDPELVYRAAIASYHARDCKAALEQLRRLKKVTAEQAPEYLRALAMCSYDLGLENDSKSAASQLLTLARTPEERESARTLVDLVNRPRWQPVELRSDRQTGMGAAATTAEGDAQASSQAPPTELRPPPPVEPKAVEGLLVQVDCQGEGARVWLQTGERKMAYLITRGNTITMLRGGLDVVGDLQCGPQQNPQKVTIRYDGQPGDDASQGIVRVLEFP